MTVGFREGRKGYEYIALHLDQSSAILVGFVIIANVPMLSGVLAIYAVKALMGLLVVDLLCRAPWAFGAPWRSEEG
jgi:hypothetical protein